MTSFCQICNLSYVECLKSDENLIHTEVDKKEIIERVDEYMKQTGLTGRMYKSFFYLYGFSSEPNILELRDRQAWDIFYQLPFCCYETDFEQLTYVVLFIDIVHDNTKALINLIEKDYIDYISEMLITT